MNDLHAKLRALDTKVIPYRPGAKFTGNFGLRTHLVGSPMHFGVDRGALPATIRMPFDGTYEWTYLGPHSDAGSLLRIVPDEFRNQLEVQVFHTVHSDPTVRGLRGVLKRNEVLPVVTGDLGFSAGAHTHTEVLLRYDTKLHVDLMHEEPFVYFARGNIMEHVVTAHCEGHGLDAAPFIERMRKQAASWQIEELGSMYGIRRAVPLYRRPHWLRDSASEWIIHVDSRWNLGI